MHSTFISFSAPYSIDVHSPETLRPLFAPPNNEIEQPKHKKSDEDTPPNKRLKIQPNLESMRLSPQPISRVDFENHGHHKQTIPAESGYRFFNPKNIITKITSSLPVDIPGNHGRPDEVPTTLGKGIFGATEGERCTPDNGGQSSPGPHFLAKGVKVVLTVPSPNVVDLEASKSKGRHVMPPSMGEESGHLQRACDIATRHTSSPQQRDERGEPTDRVSIEYQRGDPQQFSDADGSHEQDKFINVFKADISAILCGNAQIQGAISSISPRMVSTLRTAIESNTGEILKAMETYKKDMVKTVKDERQSLSQMFLDLRGHMDDICRPSDRPAELTVPESRIPNFEHEQTLLIEGVKQSNVQLTSISEW